MTPADAAKWIAVNTPGADPGNVAAALVEDLKAGAPHQQGLVDPVQYAAWLMAVRVLEAPHE